MKKTFILFISFLFINNLYGQAFLGFRSDFGIELTFPISKNFFVGYGFSQPKNEAYSALNYSNVINFNEFPQDHRETFYNQNLYSDYFEIGLNFIPFYFEFQVGITKQCDIVDCYDKYHILGADGHYQLFIDKRNVFTYGVNLKYLLCFKVPTGKALSLSEGKSFLDKTAYHTIYCNIPLYLEIGYNIHSRLYFGIGIDIIKLFSAPV